MLTRKATRPLIALWKRTWIEYRDRLRPNRKTGAEVLAYLKANYPLNPIEDERAREVVIGNALELERLEHRLPEGVSPEAEAFIVENEGAGRVLYEKQDETFQGIPIFVGVERHTAYFHVEGSSLLWDALYAFRGLDEAELKNFYCVAEYVGCLRRFGHLEAACR